MNARFFVDGEAVRAEDFVISGVDEGLTVGLNVFETMRTYHGRLFRVAQHVDRLLESARVVGVPHPSHAELIQELGQAVQGVSAPVKARLLLTMGGRRLTHVSPLEPERLQANVRAETRVWEPSPWLDGRIKHGSRAAGEVARRSAGVDELLWVGRDNCLTEGTRSSIFGVVDGTLITPPVDGRILAGVTRGALLEAAAEANIQVDVAPLRLDAPMSELYSTSTLREMSPIVELDGRPGPGSGPVGQRLLAAFHALVERECGS